MKTISELAPVAFEVVKVLQQSNVSPDDAVTALVMATGQLIARHYEAGSAREAFANVVNDDGVYRVFELAWRLQREQQSTILLV